MGTIVENKPTSELVRLQKRCAELEHRIAELQDPRCTDRYRASFERSADAILIIDGDKFIDCNDATVRMLRYRDKSEFLQTHPSELSPERQPDGRLSVEKADEILAIAFEKGSHRFEWSHLRADGEVFPVEVLLTAVPEDGNRQTLYCVWRDITDRKRLEEDLRHAQKMEAIGKLVGGIAHDFNNLLVSILGYSEYLIVELEDQPILLGEVKEISRAAERAASLTSQLLTFSRKQVVKLEAVDFVATVVNLEGVLRRTIGEAIILNFENSTEPLAVEADRGQMEQVVLNLVSNAQDAMPKGGKLTLVTQRVVLEEADHSRLPPGEYVSLTVVDTGEGMDAKVASQAFDPFFTTKPPGRGTGLGLSSVYGIVNQSGGDIAISSQPGEGTEVRVLLPLISEQTVPVSVRVVEPPKRTASDQTVFVVEDEPAVARFLRETLNRAGFRVEEARDGAEALRRIQDEGLAFDLLLTDVIMPIMAGPQLVCRIREEMPNLRVLFISGYTENVLVDQGFAVDDVELLPKPFSPRKLVARVWKILDASVPVAIATP